MQTSFVVPKRKHTREGARWSRSGCLTCKKRRKRCDETKPSCNNCIRLGRTCEGYGSLWAEPDTPHKRRRPSSPSAQSTRSDSISDIASSPVSISAPSPSDVDEEEDVDEDSGSALTLARPTQTTLSSNEAHYLQYHIEQGSRLLTNLENDDNPLRSLLVPRALASPLLRNATCAMSAIHFSNRAQDGFVARTAATDYYLQTVRQLRAMLAGSPVTGAGAGAGCTPDEMIIAVGVLCKYEIVRGSVRQWAVHLDALRKLILARGGYRALEPATAEMIWGFFVYAHNIAKVTNTRYRSITANEGDELDPGGITKLDIYVGYTEDMLRLCSRITNLPSLDRLSLEIEVGDIDNILQTWSPSSKPYIYPSGISQGSLLRLQAVAECFRDAAYIHLHSTLEQIQTYEGKPEVLSRSKLDALDTCLARIASFLPGSPETTAEPEMTICPAHCEFSALTFPLFFTGCECQTAEQRGVVLTALELLGNGYGIGNVKRVKEVLGDLWSNGQKDWGGVLGELGWELIVV